MSWFVYGSGILELDHCKLLFSTEMIGLLSKRHFDGRAQMVMVSKSQLAFPLVMENTIYSPFPNVEMNCKYLNSFPGMELREF